MAWELQERTIILPLLRQIRQPYHRQKFSSASRKVKHSSQFSDCTRLVHSRVSFPEAFSVISSSSWLSASVLPAAVCVFGLPPRAAASCTSRSAMRWFSFSNRTFPSWASRSQCSFSCSSRAIFSWLCCTCRKPTGRGEGVEGWQWGSQKRAQRSYWGSSLLHLEAKDGLIPIGFILMLWQCIWTNMTQTTLLVHLKFWVVWFQTVLNHWQSYSVIHTQSLLSIS